MRPGHSEDLKYLKGMSVSTFHHCHPSGELVPSTEDCSLTHKLKAGGKLLDLDILDHLIISRDGYYSFGDEGIL